MTLMLMVDPAPAWMLPKLAADSISDRFAEEKENKNGEKYVAFNAASPDELALVNGARHMGFSFTERDEENNMII